MQSSFIASLSFLMIANNTIKSSYLLKNQYEINLAMLPQFSFSTLTFQNLWFKQMNVVHFTPISFNSCRFGSSLVYVESNNNLIIQNCVNLSGHIKAINRNIFVQSTKLSDNFKTFELINANGLFQDSIFSSHSKEQVIIASKSNITVKNCNFSNCLFGGIKALQETNLNLSNCMFNKMESDEGAAIFFYGNQLNVLACIFQQCKASKSGGAIKFNGKTDSHIIDSTFIKNESPKGNSIYIKKTGCNVYFKNCSNLSSKDDIYYNVNDEINIKWGEEDLDSSGNIPVEGVQPSLMSETSPFSQSHSFTPSSSWTPPPTQSPFPTKPPTPTPNPSSTPYPVEKGENKDKNYLIFVIIICAAVVIIAIVAVTAILIQKKKNQIYPSDYDGDDEEPKKTTVTVPNIHDIDP